MQTAARTAISQCIQENSPLLDYPSSTTTSSGKLKGPLGDLGIFSNGKSVPVWKPSKTHSVDRSSDGRGSEIDMTRVCTIRFNCPSSVIHRVWFDQHHQRNTWDTRTCLESTKKATYPAEKNELSPLNLFSLISQPKPLISPRDFLYAYKEIPYEGEGRLYAGSSVDLVDGVELTEFQSENKNAVRAWLQGMVRKTLLCQVCLILLIPFDTCLTLDICFFNIVYFWG